MDPATREHDPRWPLLVGLGVALALHALALPWFFSGLAGTGRRRVDKLAPLRHPTPRRTPLGTDTGRPVSLAWIPHKDFRKLLAPHAPTPQPAVQTKAKPTPHAPPRLDPTRQAPSPKSKAESRKSKVPSPSPKAKNQKPKPKVESPKPKAPKPNPRAKTKQPKSAHQKPTIARSTETPKTHRRPPSAAPRRRTRPSPPARPAPPGKPKPTSAARSPSEAAPASVTLDAGKVQPGRVLTARGLEVHTVHPKFSAVTRASTLPDRDPRALITFNPRGSVVAVKLIRSSGAENIDAPILSSLYSWKATGEALKKYHRPFTIQVTVRLLSDQ